MAKRINDNFDGTIFKSGLRNYNYIKKVFSRYFRYDDRLNNNRYDDRRTYYNVKPLSYADTYDNKYGGYNDYRGNGYDNRDQYYANPNRGGNDQYYRGGNF